MNREALAVKGHACDSHEALDMRSQIEFNKKRCNRVALKPTPGGFGGDSIRFERHPVRCKASRWRWPSMRSDRGALIAMSVVLPRLDLEEVALSFARSGFPWMEVHYSQLEVPARTPLSEAGARVAGAELLRLGIKVSSFNVVGRERFVPHGGRAAMESSVACLADDLRWGAAMGAQRVLVWDGCPSDDALQQAPSSLRRCIEEARKRSELSEPPEVSVELHPFTFALRHDRLEALSDQLLECGAGICLDFCHFGVALGPDFVERLNGQVLGTVNHVHFADTDCTTPELHFPPGRGCLDLARLRDTLAGLNVAIAWDLFAWPAPRKAIAESKETYAAFVKTSRREASGERAGGQ